MMGRTARLVTGVAVVASLVLAGCGSGEEAPAASPSAGVGSASATAGADPALAGTAVAAACAAYFELDLLNSSYAGGAVADGDMTEQQVKEDFARLLQQIVKNAKVAVAEGDANAKLLANATRMRAAVKSLDKDQALADLSKKQQAAFAKQSLRVQRACDRAGFALPADNITARTAAGI